MLLRTSLVCLLIGFESISLGGEWHAGTARANITPQESMWMSGYGSRDRPAQGKLTDLWAKVMTLRDGKGRRAVLVTLDLVGIHRDTSQKICDQLIASHAIDRDQIAINCSHTHSGPVVGQNLGPLHYYRIPESQQALVNAYELELIVKVTRAVEESIKSEQPCSLTWGSGHCSVAVNRRNNNQSRVAELRPRGELVGPFDHDVPVLIVRNTDMSLRTIVFGYACHATTLSGYEWCGDYPGYAQAELESLYPSVNAMFWAGCGADQNPLPRRTIDLAKSYGERLARAVAEVVEGFVQPLEPRLQTSFANVNLPVDNLPTVDALKVVAENGDAGYEQARARYLLDRLDDGGKLPTHYAYPVQTWLLGDEVRFVFLGGEVVIDYALRLKTTAIPGLTNQRVATWVAGYSNDVMAYIPSRRVLAEGGYEGGGSNVYYGLPGLWSPQIEQLIVDEVEQQLISR